MTETDRCEKPRETCGPWVWIYGTATPPAYGPVAVLVCERCGKRAPFMGETWDTSVVGRRIP